MIIRRFSNNKNRELLPNLTPLIDVVFLLLIFFMVATTFDDFAGLKIEMPTSKSLVDNKKDVEEISVLMNRDGIMKLKSTIEGVSEVEEVNLDNISKNLEVLLNRSKKGRVNIFADRDIDYGRVVDIMSLAKEKGAKVIDIKTKRK